MMHSISILGSTGSIGRQTVAVAEHLGLDVRALTTNRNIQLVEEQARRLHPAFVAVYDETAAKALRIALADTDIAVGSGERGLCEAAVISGAQTVVTAVSGAVGLRPTLEAIEKGRRIALANKETLVCAGEIVMQRARQFDAEIVPVDSEHSAIFQCLTGRNGELKKILLTGSGGPFRGWTREQTASVTPEQAVKHPNWSMGA
ncbi:MAG: 1-deoxy-D-xylulose-5-phosphate reductoisomerase, partial [Clostridiales bacterium]|nr:1-deoxy-D-xylulose-5-phosphate reductoisomerase [Clostridiales bacterium]